MRKGRRVAAGTGLALSAAFVAPAVTQAATYTVTNTNDSGAGSLRAAIASANFDGIQDAITFASGVTGSIHLHSQLGIANPVTIDTSGAGGAVTLDGSAIGGTIMNIGTPPGSLVGLTGLTFTHGGSSSPSVKGGAIKTFGADLRIHSSSLTGNTAGGGGGALYGSGSGTILIDSGTQITDNVSGGDGGGVLTATQSGPGVEMQHATVSGNQAAGSGGGVSLGDAAATLDQSVFASNISGSTGGGITTGGTGETGGADDGGESIGRAAERSLSIVGSSVKGSSAAGAGVVTVAVSVANASSRRSK